MPFVNTLQHDDIHYIPGEVVEIDIEKETVTFIPNIRSGAASEKIKYDYLVIALGARLAYDQVPGFDEFGFTLSDSYYGNKLRQMNEGGD